MNRLCLKIVLVLTVICLVGCNEQEQQDPVPDPLAGIKINDLASDHPEQVPPEITFNVFLFEIPAENGYLIEDIFAPLYQRQIHFTDYKMFQANKLLAGFGIDPMWAQISPKLLEAKAQRMLTASLIIFEEMGEDIISVPINFERTVFYTDADGNLIGKSLSSGALTWRLQARPISSVKGVAQVHFEPMFRTGLDIMLTQMGKETKPVKNEFAFAGFDVQMSIGDFILLGPTKYQSDQLTLSSLFFTLQKDKPVIRLYLIVCTGVGN